MDFEFKQNDYDAKLDLISNQLKRVLDLDSTRRNHVIRAQTV